MVMGRKEWGNTTLLQTVERIILIYYHTIDKDGQK